MAPAGRNGSAGLRWLVRHGHDPIAYDNLSEGNAAAVPASSVAVRFFVSLRVWADQPLFFQVRNT